MGDSADSPDSAGSAEADGDGSSGRASDIPSVPGTEEPPLRRTLRVLRLFLAGAGVAALLVGLAYAIFSAGYATHSELSDAAEDNQPIFWAGMGLIVAILALVPMAVTGRGRPAIRFTFAAVATVSGAVMVQQLWPYWLFEYTSGERADYWSYEIYDLWFWLSLVAITAGAGLYAATWAGGGPLWQGWPPLLGAGSAALTVVLVMVSVMPLEEEVTQETVEHVTADPPGGEAPSYPESVSETAWEWMPSEDVIPTEVRAAEQGVFVEVLDGGLLLDGETGEEVWRYRRPGHSVSTGVSTDGQTITMAVALPYADHLGTGSGAELLTLDAATGEITDEHTLALFVDQEDEAPEDEILVGEHSVEVYSGTGTDIDTDQPLSRVDVDDDDIMHVLPHAFGPVVEDHLISLNGFHLGGYDANHMGAAFELSTLERAWTRPGEEGDCTVDNHSRGDRAVLAGDLVLVSHICRVSDRDDGCDDPNGCPESMGVVAWDAESGEERWRHEWDAESEATSPPAMRVSGEARNMIDQPSSGSHLAYRDFGDRGDHVLISRSDTWHEGMFVLDGATGEVLAEDPLADIEAPPDEDERNEVSEPLSEPVALDSEAYYLRLTDPNGEDETSLTRVELDAPDDPTHTFQPQSDGLDSCSILAEAVVCGHGMDTSYRYLDTDNHDPRIEVAGFDGDDTTISLEHYLKDTPEDDDRVGPWRFHPVPGALLLTPTTTALELVHPADQASRAEAIIAGEEEPDSPQVPIIALN